MASHTLDPAASTVVDVFSRDRAPVLTVAPGDALVVRSLDASGYLRRPTAPGSVRRGCCPTPRGTA